MNIVMKKILFTLVLLLAIGQRVWAQQEEIPQQELADMLATLDLDSCRITDIGVVASDVEVYLMTDSVTQKIDTTLVVNAPEIVWKSDGYDVNDLSATAKMRKARRGPTSGTVQQYGRLMDIFFGFYYYVFSYEYSSIDADGNPITLSAMAACPTTHYGSNVNNVIIGTHITITADSERPTSHFNNFGEDDWGMLFSLAAGPKMVLTEEYTMLLGAGTQSWIAGVLGAAVCCVIPVVGWVAAGAVLIASTAASIGSFVFLADQMDKALGYHGYNNNLVIMADYEGYGVTKNRAHPYLYQDLTARQCIDATLYGIKLYNSSELMKYIRLPFRKDFRTMSCGYSQGGSVAMAVHRFVEQNNLDKTLHFSGSFCGDGPYDPISTLMYYVGQEKSGQQLSMPVVLPLIVKGMLDTNPYMVSHKAEDYFNPKFLETGVMDWLASKEKSTVDIEGEFKRLYEEGKDGDVNYYRDIFVKGTSRGRQGDKMADITVYRARLSGVVNAECYAYFSALYDKYKNKYTSASGIPLPIRRGVMEDLHLALASNDMTKGWQPRHVAYLFHSTGDTVVPYVNAQKAKNTLGSWVTLESAPNHLDHVDSGTDFFKGDSDIADIVFNRTINLRLYDTVEMITGKSY